MDNRARGITCVFSLLLLFAVISVTVMPADLSSETGYRLKVVVDYEYDYNQNGIDLKTAERHLSGLSIFDRSGNLIQWWLLSNGSDGVSYVRWERVYDNRGNETNESQYESSKSEPGQAFSVSYLPRRVDLLPALDEKLVRSEYSQYDRFGHLRESRTVDGDGKLLERITRRYDASGNLIGSHHEKGDGTVLCDSTTTRSEGNLVATQIFHNCPENTVSKIVTHYDRSGREILDEQYSISKRDGSLVITNRAANSYSGDLTNLDWTFWDANGDPSSKLLVVDKGDYEISRKEFSAKSTSGQSGKQALWTAGSEEIRQYTFDRNGNVIKEIWQRRESPDKPFKISGAYERVVTYF